MIEALKKLMERVEVLEKKDQATQSELRQLRSRIVQLETRSDINRRDSRRL
jgi:prefoldin subunit 5